MFGGAWRARRFTGDRDVAGGGELQRARKRERRVSMPRTAAARLTVATAAPWTSRVWGQSRTGQLKCIAASAIIPAPAAPTAAVNTGRIGYARASSQPERMAPGTAIAISSGEQPNAARSNE